MQNEASSFDWATVYGTITETIGTVCGVLALYRTISKDRIKLRLETSIGTSIDADGPHYSITIYNDGRDIIVNSICATVYGRLSTEVNQIMADSMKKNDKWRKRQPRTNLFPCKVQRNERIEHLHQPYPWLELSRVNKPWSVSVELASGEIIEIPSWRLAHSGPIHARSKLFSWGHKLRINLGHQALKTETMHRRAREAKAAESEAN